MAAIWLVLSAIGSFQVGRWAGDALSWFEGWLERRKQMRLPLARDRRGR
jgi:hypothetical protein